MTAQKVLGDVAARAGDRAQTGGVGGHEADAVGLVVSVEAGLPQALGEDARDILRGRSRGRHAGAEGEDGDRQ